MSKSDIKQARKLEKIINKENDLNVFQNLDDMESYEEFVILTSKRDYINNLNHQNQQGRGSESGVGSFISKEMFKNGSKAVADNMAKYLDKKQRQTNVARFFMLNTTFMNFEETEIDTKSVDSAVMIASKIIINTLLKSTKYELINDEETEGLGAWNNYVKVLTTYKAVGIAILEEQILNSVIIQQPDLAKSLLNRTVNDDVFEKFNKLAKVNTGITCVLKNGKDQKGNLLLNTNHFDKDNDIVKIGAFFVENIINNVDIFDCKKIKSGKEFFNMFAINQKFLTKMTNFENMNSMMKPRFLPKPAKFGKPIQWDSLSGGCFEHIDVDFIKNVRRDVKKELNEESYTEIYESANNLQNTVYSVNNTVYSVINKLVNADTRFRNESGNLILPYRAGNLASELPKLPAHLELVKDDIKAFTKARNEWFNKNSGKKNKKLPSRLDIESKSKKFQKLFKEYKEHQIKVRLENEFLQANSSKYTALIQAIDVAKMMGDEPFYLTTQIDWRTRYYYMCVLNPQTSDNIKGMLQLGNAERVSTDDELYFMFNCGANDYGYDKKHPDFKRDWVLENMDIIAECGKNPMDNIEFWGQADKPFMFLNFCTEIAQYVDNNKEYIDSKYICFFDGSCNGSQHFAGMTGDRQTAVLTNLTNDIIRHDLYSVVSETTTKLIEGIKDGTYTDEILIKTKFGQEIIKLKDYFKEHSEEALAYGISRKLVKQNVMTMTYGATAFGRRSQVESVYKSVIQSKGTLPFSQESVGYKASLVSSVAYGAIVKENPGVSAAMNWLEDCMSVFGEVVFKDDKGFHQEGLSPKWAGVTGAEVIQTYNKTKTEQITFRAASKKISIYHKVAEPMTDLARNRQGIIANITHYQDATHMTKCINECAKHFSGFVCVHDSFGVSVRNASKLYNIVRYTFADMYKTAFLDELYEQWFKQISQYSSEVAMKLPRPPARGDYDVAESLESVYSFI